MSSETVSNERLADITEIISLIVKQGDCRIYDAESKVPLPFKFDTLLRAITELQSLRSKPVASGVEVKPIGPWRRGYCDDRVTIEQISFGGLYQVRVLDGVVNVDWPDRREPTNFPTVGEAKAAAEADYRNRIMSALLSKATAPVVSEPVAFVSPGQFEDHGDPVPDEEPFGGLYLPVRLTRAGNFSMPLYASSHPQPKAVTEEMVERAMASIEGEPDLFITKGALRWALEAALKED